jgi:hypothetical protein
MAYDRMRWCVERTLLRSFVGQGGSAASSLTIFGIGLMSCQVTPSAQPDLRPHPYDGNFNRENTCQWQIYYVINLYLIQDSFSIIQICSTPICSIEDLSVFCSNTDYTSIFDLVCKKVLFHKISEF